MDTLSFTDQTRRPANVVAMLPPPDVPAAYEGELDPYAGGEEVRVLVPFDPDSMVQGSTIFLEVTVRGSTNFWVGRHPVVEGDGSEPLEFRCPAALLRVEDGRVAAFYYDVDGRVFSDARGVTIRRGAGPTLDAPWVRDTVDDLGAELRLDDRNGERVYIVVDGHDGVPGDAIIATWAPLGGEAYGMEGIVEETGQPLELSLPYRIANGPTGTVDVSYVRQRGSEPPVRSRTRRLRVIHSLKPPHLPAPVIPAADDEGHFRLLDELPLIVVLDVREIEPGAELTLLWYVQGMSDYRMPVPQPSNGEFMHVAVAEVVPLVTAIGRDVDVSFSVEINGTPIISDSTFASVEKPSNRNPLLPPPVMVDAPDGILDLNIWKGNEARLVAAIHPYHEPRQTYWVHFYGADRNGEKLAFVVTERMIIGPPQDGVLSVGIVTREQLEQFMDNSDIVMELRVAFDYQQIYIAHATLFPITTITIRQELG
jgi:hypothetical protein